MNVPTKIWLFRITHIDNLPHVLAHGLVTAEHPDANPGYVRIGDSSLIEYRKDLLAIDPPAGALREYIPFYLGPRSPMLLQIATGWEDIPRVEQESIIYLISSLDKVKEHSLEYFFADGHVRSATSTYFNNDRDLDRLDWEAIYTTDWKNNEQDLRRKEKKQSELLVKHFMPWECVEYLGVFNDLARQRVERMLNESGKACAVRVSPKQLYYQL